MDLSLYIEYPCFVNPEGPLVDIDHEGAFKVIPEMGFKVDALADGASLIIGNANEESEK